MSNGVMLSLLYFPDSVREGRLPVDWEAAGCTARILFLGSLDTADSRRHLGHQVRHQVDFWLGQWHWCLLLLFDTNCVLLELYGIDSSPCLPGLDNGNKNIHKVLQKINEMTVSGSGLAIDARAHCQMDPSQRAKQVRERLSG